MRRVCIVAGLAGGCIAPQGEAPVVVDPDALPDPEVTSATLSCDRQAGRWSLDVRTSAWAGGGSLVWTTDGVYVERHNGLRSVRAGADGLSDRLALDVSIVDAVQGAASGRTLLRCTAEPAAAIRLESLDGRLVDCVRLSDDARLDDVEGVGVDCRVLVDDSDEGG